MELLLLGGGMGVVGGLVPSPLHLIAITQAALGRWLRALFVLVVPPLVVDGLLLLITFFFYQYIPPRIAHDVAYAGGAILIGFAVLAFVQMRRKGKSELGESRAFTYATISVAALAEITAPGTWIYWLAVAGPIIEEGRHNGYWHVLPFFAGSLLGYYGAAVLSVWLITWGASLHRRFNEHLLLVANVLLFVIGVFYFLRAYLGR